MPRNKYPEVTARKILDASLKLFLEKGYEETTILDIVNNLGGLTRGAFYHHFKSKEDVLYALMDRVFAGDDPFVSVREEEGANGAEKLRKAFFRNIDLVNNKEFVQLQRIAASLLGNPRFLAESIKRNQQVAKDMIPLIREGMADGSIREGDPKILADLALLLFNLWLIPTIYPCGQEEFRQKILTIKQIFDALGFPVFNDEFVGKTDAMIKILGVKK